MTLCMTLCISTCQAFSMTMLKIHDNVLQSIPADHAAQQHHVLDMF